MFYRLDVEIKGHIYVEADNSFGAYEVADKHPECIIWDNWKTYTGCKECQGTKE